MDFRKSRMKFLTKFYIEVFVLNIFFQFIIDDISLENINNKNDNIRRN